MSNETEQKQKKQKLSRRHLLLGGAAGAITTAAVLNAEQLARAVTGTEPESATWVGQQKVTATGLHQAGIATVPQAFVSYLAFRLKKDANAGSVQRMLRLLTDNIQRLTAGEPAIGDTEPELAALPAALTVTVGFGENLFRYAGLPVPDVLKPLPTFKEDRLTGNHDGGDLILQLGGDDQVALSHASRMLQKDLRAFGSLIWRQDGFRNTPNVIGKKSTMRNLMGQVDGTVNLQPGTDEFDRLVWMDGVANADGAKGNAQGLLAGGTTLVLRRIRMTMDTWDEVDRLGKEESVGRTLAVGAPLTGVKEHDEPNFHAKDGLGFPVIGEYSHIRRARHPNPDVRIFRRAYNYDDSDQDREDIGLLFASFQKDPHAQFVPIQERLDAGDMLNIWVHTEGSGLYYIPPGFKTGDYIGEALFS